MRRYRKLLLAATQRMDIDGKRFDCRGIKTLRPRRHHAAEDHEQRVHGGHRVEEARIDELQAGLEEFRANHERHRAAAEEHDAGEHQVHRADVFVVRGVQPALQAVRLVVVVIVGVIGVCSVSHGLDRSR